MGVSIKKQLGADTGGNCHEGRSQWIWKLSRHGVRSELSGPVRQKCVIEVCKELVVLGNELNKSLWNQADPIVLATVSSLRNTISQIFKQLARCHFLT
eukprot:XP_001707508.1 Hypothetical protein GL50803_37659 [Giardia lamblia ATCC 50803]